MDKRKRKIPIFVMFIFLFVGGCSFRPCCYDPTKDQEIRFPRGIASYGDIRAYTFDPEVLLTKLEQNDETIFKLLSDWGQEPVFPSGSFAWQQMDYFKIASALNHIAVQDSLEEWSIYSVHFSRDCANNPNGFDNFAITYFKIDGEQYIARTIEVWPLSKEAVVGVDQPFPRPFPIGWQNLDLKNLKVTAEEALQTAEISGGKEARLAVNNKCSIFVSLDEKWYITYQRSGSGTYFQTSIDPYVHKEP